MLLLLSCLLCLVVSTTSQMRRSKKKADRLTSIYLEYNESEGFDHWLDYAHHYHRHVSHLLSKYENRTLQMLEIGIQSGGSTRIWSKYFGKILNYTGIDINPNCAIFESPDLGVQVRIGSQLNEVSAIVNHPQPS